MNWNNNTVTGWYMKSQTDYMKGARLHVEDQIKVMSQAEISNRTGGKHGFKFG